MHSNKAELSKTILEKLTKAELNTLNTYQQNHRKLGDKMLEYQRAYTDYVRKTNDNISLKVRKMADKGFKYELLTYDAYQKLESYRNLLKKKYANK